MSSFRLWQNYSRRIIAEELGIKSEEALWRGVFTPQGKKLIFLFVTRNKQRSQTQYKDSIFGDTLLWEGGEKHGNDQRIVNAKHNGDRIFLFYRIKYRQPFVYFGRIHLQNYELRSGRPSRFIFKIGQSGKGTVNEVPVTERATTRQERIGQSKFRGNVLELWSGSCAVTSLQHPKLLRASHIRPWRHCSNKDRLNKYNGLALVPNLDLLFDIGLVSFKGANGSIMLSDAFDARDWRLLSVRSEMSLRMVFPKSKEYLEYHNECVFEAWKKKEHIEIC